MNLDKVGKLQNLSSKENGTTLITYIICGGDSWLYKKRLNSEIKSALNIKNKNVRHSVIKYLKIIIKELDEYKKIPSNGLVILVGEIKEYI
jgi:peptide subunit release factor 1 (eRF1)